MVNNMLIDEYIKKIEQVINNGDQNCAENLFKEIIRLYRDEISDLDSGTSDLSARFNRVLNLNFNDPKDMLSTDTDYIDDLKIILPKLRKYSEKTKMSQNTQTMNNSVINNYNKINDSSIRISDSSISKSTIGFASQEKEKKGKGKIIVSIIGALAGIATIIGTIFAILHQLGKL